MRPAGRVHSIRAQAAASREVRLLSLCWLFAGWGRIIHPPSYGRHGGLLAVAVVGSEAKGISFVPGGMGVLGLGPDFFLPFEGQSRRGSAGPDPVRVEAVAIPLHPTSHGRSRTFKSPRSTLEGRVEKIPHRRRGRAAGRPVHGQRNPGYPFSRFRLPHWKLPALTAKSAGHTGLHQSCAGEVDTECLAGPRPPHPVAGKSQTLPGHRQPRARYRYNLRGENVQLLSSIGTCYGQWPGTRQ